VKLGIHDCRAANQLSTTNLDSDASFRYNLDVQLRIYGNTGLEHRIDVKRTGRLRVTFKPKELLILILSIFILGPVDLGFAEINLCTCVDLTV
jgi:hypothetical protein